MDSEKIIEPAFDFSNCKSIVLLPKSPAEINVKGDFFECTVEITLDLLPQPRIHLYSDFNKVPSLLTKALMEPESKKLLINGCEIEVFVEKYNINFKKDYPLTLSAQFTPTFEPINIVGDDSTHITHLVFHLFNFVDFIGTRRFSKRIGTKTYFIEHVDLKNDQWKIELQSIPSTKENIKALKTEGGYQLTHVGKIEKANNAPFTGKEAKEILEALRFFLSFARGFWCVPVLPVGFDESGKRVWELWSRPLEPWRTCLTWFDQNHSFQLEILFPNFMTCWSNGGWKEALQEAIYWYLIANDSKHGIDAGIVLTQTAIERLSYEFAVNNRKLLGREGFKKLPASDKFRLLLSSLGIQIDLSTETPELQKLSHQNKWQDAPHALTEIRNAIVHPERNERKELNSAYVDAWNLGLWYLEMSILAICGYSGTYGNRLRNRFIGDVEQVPWKK